MGPNSATGHSSVIFTSEAQITMILKLIKPILASPTMTKPVYISVKKEAEVAYMAKLRNQMKAKVWEKDGGVSWYVDRATGMCTTLYPWSQVSFSSSYFRFRIKSDSFFCLLQVHFWWNATFPVKSNFERVGF
jgi:hypothetical protein